MTKTCCPPDCPRRSITCRGSCEAWAAHEAEKAITYAERVKNNEFKDYKCRVMCKAYRRIHQGSKGGRK